MTWLESAANLLTTGALLTWGAVDLYTRWQQRSHEQVPSPCPASRRASPEEPSGLTHGTGPHMGLQSHCCATERCSQLGHVAQRRCSAVDKTDVPCAGYNKCHSVCRAPCDAFWALHTG